MAAMLGGGGQDKEAARARADEAARQAKVRAGTERIDGIFGQNFNDGFFNGRRQSYLDYANPQLEDQYTKAQRELTFALARGGNTNSSVRGQKLAELQGVYDTRKREVSDQALGQETEARNNIESARADLIRTLNATGDAEGAATSAINRAQALSAPTPFNPISNLFADFTSALGTQAAMERAAAYSGGAIKPAFNTGLFGVSPGAVRVS